MEIRVSVLCAAVIYYTKPAKNFFLGSRWFERVERSAVMAEGHFLYFLDNLKKNYSIQYM